MVKVFKNYFDNILVNLYIKHTSKFNFESDLIANAIKSFSQRQSIVKIKQITTLLNYFAFQQESWNILYQINLLDPSKATQRKNDKKY